MNLFADIHQVVLAALDTLASDGVLPNGLETRNVTVEPPRDVAHGDMATNAAMVLAKPAKMSPRDIAQALADVLVKDSRIAAATVAGPGFLNLTLTEGVWAGVIPAILNDPQQYGRSAQGAGKKVNVEYVSANPTGPLHVGHTRGAVYGDALASLLDFAGFDVTREYYINDGGGQVDTLARSVYLRYQEIYGTKVDFPEGTYPGDYLVPIAKALAEKHGDTLMGVNDESWLPEFREFATEAMLQLIKDDLSALNITMDLFYSEKSLYGTGRIESAIDELRDKGLIYEGKLDQPKGNVPDDWEEREQTLFKSTEHGDDSDRAVMKSDGSWTYFAPDIAYHWDKIERGFDMLIDVFGVDHSGYVKRMKAAVSALSGGKVPLDVKLTQLVKLYKGGAQVKMSKRSGNYVTLREMVDEVGADVTRFHMLTRKNDAPLDFDYDKVQEQSKDNPVFYVQYAHARICSVMNKADAAGIETDDAALAAADLTKLTHPAELALIGKVAEWPRLIEAAASANEPHRVAFYLYDLASEFHSLWNRGNDETNIRFLNEDDVIGSKARLGMIRAVAVVISSGLAILGVTPKREMR
jgi:arginyl-tRNA synthetase